MRDPAIVALVILVGLVSGTRAETKDDAYATVTAWAEAFNGGSSDKVVALYAPDASFWGTIAPTLATTPEALKQYFDGAMGTGFSVKLGEHTTVKLSDGAVVDAGQYDFTRLRDGQTFNLTARYTFVLVKRAESWAIAHHHSSLMPLAPK